MDLQQAMTERRSIRAYQDKAVSPDILRKIIDRAAKAPSAGNTQPWEVVVAQGTALETVRAESERLFLDGVPAKADLPNVFNVGKLSDAWPEQLATRYQDCGRLILGTLGIERGDKAGRQAFYRAMYRFFEAPVLLLVGFNKQMPEGYAMFDLGLFAQNLCLTAHAEGLGTCIMAVGAFYPEMMRTKLPIPPHLQIGVGIALGYPDNEAPINRFERQYAPLEEWVHGL
ncbi:MAG: nfnB [Proteobacteria bacterium]|nr:nfnB [Pseudomonadota bacterium]